MNAMLETARLSVGYGKRTIAEGIELSAEPGRILTLIGPNGAGKSTLLKTLLRQLPPLAGAIWLDGRSLDGMKEREIARLSAAVLTERPEPELMNCYDVVSAGRYPYTGRLGVLSDHDREKVDAAMEMVGVAGLRERDFTRLSDGQRQRVLLARALCQEPKLLLMDEPTSFLDLRHKLDFLSLLRELAERQQLAVILSLHELELAQKFSDRIICLKNGQVDRCGTPEEIFTGGYIEQLYAVERGHYDVRFGSVEPLPLTGEPRVFVIGGGGSAIPVYRALFRRGVPFAAGVLPENDVELPVARALSQTVFTDRAFEPVGEESVKQALAVLRRCEAVICCAERFGSQNIANRSLLDFAQEQGLLLPPESLEIV